MYQIDQFTYDAIVPTVSGVSTTAGPLGGNNSVTITGTGFLGTTGVMFGTTAAQSFTIVSDTTLTAVAPAESAGTVDVTVATSAGSSSQSSADHYTYMAAPALQFVSPYSDTATGGTPITESGSGFTGATAVDFGNTVITAFTINSDTSLTVTTPADAVGNVPLTVVGPGGTSNGEQFSFTPANTVTWIAGNGDWATPGNWSGGQLPGPGDDVVIPSGVTVTHDTGTDTIHQISDGGTVLVSGGTLTIDATGTLTNLDISGGTLDGTGALTISGDFTGGGGTLDSTSPTTLEGSSSLAGDLTIGGTVINDGTATWTGDGTIQFTGGTFDNEPGSTFVAGSNDSLQTIDGNGTFINDGTFGKTGGAPTTIDNGVSFDNSGDVTIDNGTLTLGGGDNTGTVTVDNGAGLTISGDFTLTGSSSITGSGTVDVGSSGDLNLGGTVTAGSVTIDQGGTAGGSATIDSSLTNNGTLDDGGAIGVLTINGNFTQTSTGTLSLTVNSSTAGTGYDQLRISGMANLGGTLNVSTTTAYIPAQNTSFSLLTYNSLFSGSSFGTIQATFGAPTTSSPQYNSTGFNLVAMASENLQTPQSSDSQTDNPSMLFTPDDDRSAMMLASLTPANMVSANDQVFAAASDDGPAAAGDDAVWEGTTSLEEMLTLPLRMMEAVVEAVV